MNPPAGPARIASLDGLRAVSIALVLAGHSLTFSAHERIGDLANLGVRVFFVISGLLITHLLLRELDKQGSISLRRFFARRALRIIPPLWMFLATMFVVERLGWLPRSDGGSWARALTYTINYMPPAERPWHLGHIWSLAVEEQFYLLWPTAIVLIGVRRSLKGAAAVLVLVPCIRFFTWRYLPSHADGIKWEFQTVCDALAVGCLVAGMRDRLWELATYRRLMQSAWPLLLIPAVFALNWSMVGRPQLAYLFGISGLNVAIAFFIEYCIRGADSLGGRVLNTRPAIFIGTISYSMYLWQQVFVGSHPSNVLQTLPINILITIAIAATSYLAFERPLLALRHKLSRV